MQWAKRVDLYFREKLTRRWTPAMRRHYLENLSFTRDETSEHRAALRNLDQLDTKASGTLTHISMMIAALGVTARAEIINHESERFIVYLTMSIYLILSVLCLRCMTGFAVESIAGPRAPFLEHLTDELIYRKELYGRANAATTILTAIVFVLIFFFYFY
jgi:hypothetical protein